MAVATAASQEDPAKKRNVVVPANGSGTLGTAGTRVNNGLSFGKARDADIEKTAEEKSKDECENCI